MIKPFVYVWSSAFNSSRESLIAYIFKIVLWQRRMNKVNNVLVVCWCVCSFVWYGFLLCTCVICLLVFFFRSSTRNSIVLSATYFLCLSIYKSEINIQSENLKYVHAINVHFKLYLRNEQTRQIHMNDLNVDPTLSNFVQWFIITSENEPDIFWFTESLFYCQSNLGRLV